MPDGVVWWPDRPVTPGRVAVVTVSYNTRELTALMLWSLGRILRWEAGALQIVVVDNGSRDGSAELLARIESAGGCRLIRNASNIMHGPAVTQAISFLASSGSELPQWVWVLDSDVVISKPDALERAVKRAKQTNAAIVGESWWDPWQEASRFLAYSLLINPVLVWRDGIEPFADGGDPALGLLQSAEAAGETLAEFSFVRDGYLLHRGRSSLSAVWESGDTRHPSYDWARDHHEPHFGLVGGAAAKHDMMVAAFRAEVGPLDDHKAAEALTIRA
ncbi:MAG TPA: glycosyltransferase family 2 protein [Trebonia sp.]|nr:glycosyltransferase family 2 protein [Trebonia sp.]